MIAANDQQERPPTAAELDLIAYLDGELDESKVAEVEGRIATDPVYAAMLGEMLALGDFVREDGDRIYAQAKVDGIADAVMSGVQQRASAIPPSSQLQPMSSVATRRKKNSVIWVAFGSVAAAAAALFFYVQGQKTPSPSVASNETPAETVAVKSPTAPTSKDPRTLPAIEPKHSLEVEDLEVGEGATVIYTTSEKGASAPVVWINAKNTK